MCDHSLIFELLLEIEEAPDFNIDPEEFDQIYAGDIPILKQTKN
jgi:hypothetical protein